MKKYIIFAAIHLFVTNTFSQLVGLKGGAVNSRIKYVDNWSNNIYLDRMHEGGFIEMDISYRRSRTFELNSSIGFLRAGGRGHKWFQDFGTIVPVTITTDFLSLTTTARFKAPIFKNACFFAGTGPKLDILTRYYDNSGLIEYFKWYNSFNRVLYGIRSEVGYRVQYKKSAFSLSINYIFSINKLGRYKQKPVTNSSHSDKAKLSYLTLGFCWAFDLSGQAN
jgi:hypothetical protein